MEGVTRLQRRRSAAQTDCMSPLKPVEMHDTVEPDSGFGTPPTVLSVSGKSEEPQERIGVE
jgi:hypothetical protein